MRQPSSGGTVQVHFCLAMSRNWQRPADYATPLPWPYCNIFYIYTVCPAERFHLYTAAGYWCPYENLVLVSTDSTLLRRLLSLAGYQKCVQVVDIMYSMWSYW